RTGVRYLVDRVENSAPVAKAFGRIFTHRFHNKTSSVNQETLDRIWFKWQSDALGAKRHYEVECALILRGETGSSCWIKTDFLPKLPDSDNTRKDNIKVMSSMTGDHSDILAVAPADYVEVFVKQWAAWKGTDSLIKAIRKETRNDSTICAAMLKPGFGGRIAGMKICTALVGFQMKDGADGLAVVNRLLDVVNKESKASLIPKREKNITGMISLDSTRPGFLKLFGQEHRPAFVERDGWLILSSSRMALEKLLKEKSTEENKWVRNIDGGTSTYVMADLSAVSDAINGVASVCGIIASAENKKDKAFEMRLQALRAWMHVLGRMGEGNCRVNVSDGTPELQFDFGS
ncbi:MAG: hypothetical protein KAH23_06425, partial [Kiritimatiellae bacterium]|nr:hypothetical protein [Kiritimatiellia bacterium]